MPIAFLLRLCDSKRVPTAETQVVGKRTGFVRSALLLRRHLSFIVQGPEQRAVPERARMSQDRGVTKTGKEGGSRGEEDSVRRVPSPQNKRCQGPPGAGG